MDFGAMMFHTDYSMPIVDLAQACEARGFAHSAVAQNAVPGRHRAAEDVL